MTPAVHLPKYIQKANQIIELISDQPDHIWAQTQRELGERLGFSQPELSNLLGTLIEAGKVRKGHPLPGIRGRNYALELVNTEPLDGPVRRKRHDDRPLDPDETLEGPLDLQSLTLEQIGAAVIRTIKETWDKSERVAQNQSEHLMKIKLLREQLASERDFRIRFSNEKENLQRQIEQRDEEIAQIRSELNKMIVSGGEGKKNGSFTVKEMLSGDELNVLGKLMREG